LAANTGTTHFCFIGVIETTSDPAPDRNLITSTSLFYDFIGKSNNYAWRNCDIDTTTGKKSIKKTFKMGAIEKTMANIELEVDARNLPDFAELQVWMPNEVIVNQKLINIKLKEPIIQNQFAFEVLRPLDVEKIIKQPVMMQERLANVERVKAMKEVAKLPIAKNKVYAFKPGTVNRINGIYTTNDIEVTFVIDFGENVTKKPFCIAFRQLFNDKCIGQMNYEFKP
jgi:hypothetical protein